MKTIIQFLRLLILGLWLGAAVFFSAAVAPTVFGVLRGAQLANAGELAGMMVQRMLAVINHGGFEIGLFLLVTGFFTSKNATRMVRSGELISLAILTIATAVSHWIVSARILAIRAALQTPVDQLAGNDPRRMAFDSLHGYSVTLMAIAVIAGLLAFFIIGSQFQQQRRGYLTRS